MVERRDQPCPLAQRVARPRLHERLEHPPVDVLDRRRALAQVLQRLERPVRIPHRDDALHRVASDVLDRGQAEADLPLTPTFYT